MAAAVNGTSSENVCSSNKLQNDAPLENSTSEPPMTNGLVCEDEYLATWGFNVNELYALSTTFLKDKEGKAFHISYKDKLLLVAYNQQVAHGKFVEEKAPPLGYLDVIGRDRRQAWQNLADMSERDAKAAFVNLLHSICPLFRPFVLAHKTDLEEKERRRKEEEERRRREAEEEEQMRLEEEEHYRLEEERRLKQEKERHKQAQQKRLIQEALNKQTLQQFKAYAEKQFPGNPDQQGQLIRQLQEQHYQQYMQQVLHEQLSPTTTPTNNNNNSIESKEQQQHQQQGYNNEGTPEDASEEDGCAVADPLSVSPAQMWTRPEVVPFREQVRGEGGDGVLRVGHGETVTVRVPTHASGRCLFWEFATDHFDLGFGLYFEWGRPADSAVTVHVSDSDDDEYEDEPDADVRDDIEKGGLLVPGQEKPPLSVVIPVYRRDCHQEVYAGSHHYPGQGVYLLKFDNSYSLWRSKTLYYRVYYTR